MSDNNGKTMDKIMSFLESKKFTSAKAASRKRKHPDVKIEYEVTTRSKDILEDNVSQVGNENSNSIATSLDISTKIEYNENSQTSLKSEFHKDNRKNFEYIWEKLKAMRVSQDAPVDLEGSHLNPDPNADKPTQNFQLLVSLILSVQTKDHATAEAMKNFKEHGLTLDNVYGMTEAEIKELIKRVNFNNNKAKFIKNMAIMVKNDFNGKIPSDLKTLMTIPGVGNKIGLLYMQHGENKVEGIAVDTHVHRISNRLGWVNTTLPDKTMEALQSFVDKSYWSEINELLVGFGQQTCLPINPKCVTCLLNDICPTGRSNLYHGGPKKKLKISVKKEEIKEEFIKEEEFVKVEEITEKFIKK
jgi:endonuclease-3